MKPVSFSVRSAIALVCVMTMLAACNRNSDGPSAASSPAAGGMAPSPAGSAASS